MSDGKQSAEPEQQKKPGKQNAKLANNRVGEGTELGAICVHHSVIALIARQAALKVPGVVDMSGSFTDGIAGMIVKNAGDRGIKVKVEGQSVSVEMNVVIEYGVRIPQVAWRIQNDVRRAIEELTGKKVKAVDIVVQGVRCASETKQEGEKK